MRSEHPSCSGNPIRSGSCSIRSASTSGSTRSRAPPDSLSIADWVHTDVRGWTLTQLADDQAEAALVARARRELARFVTEDGSVAFATPALVGTVVVR